MKKIQIGKNEIFGWSSISEEGKIIIPDNALKDFNFQGDNKLILISGSKSHGGFSLTTMEKTADSPLGMNLKKLRSVSKYEMPAGKIMTRNGTAYCWLWLTNGMIELKPGVIHHLGLQKKDKLLVLKQSSLVLSFYSKGPVFKEAEKIKV